MSVCRLEAMLNLNQQLVLWEDAKEAQDPAASREGPGQLETEGEATLLYFFDATGWAGTSVFIQSKLLAWSTQLFHPQSKNPPPPQAQERPQPPNSGVGPAPSP